jgi:hypothetical protein
MPTPEADKKTLAQASGVPTKTEALVQKACKVILGLDDDVLARRGVDPADVKALAAQLSSGIVPQAAEPTEPVNANDVPPELMDPPTTVPDGEPETGSDEAEDPNPGHLTYEDIDAMTKSELKDVAKDCGLPTSGTKTELFNSIVDYLGLVD